MTHEAPQGGGQQHRTAHGLKYVPRPDTCVIDGDEDSPRRMTVDFDGFVSRLLATPTLDQEYLGSLLTGADLIDGIENLYPAGYGTAAPSAGPDATPAEQFAALTDEAFERAETLLHHVPTYDDFGDPHLDPEMQSTELQLALAQLVNGNFLFNVRSALLEAPAAADSVVGPEFI